MLRIFDKTKDGLLISLLTLLELLETLISNFDSKQLEVIRARSGYGQNVCNLEDKLDNNERVWISIDELRSWLTRGEYFESARFRSTFDDLIFGVEDSTYLLVDSNDEDLIAKIAKNFYEKTFVKTRS